MRTLMARSLSGKMADLWVRFNKTTPDFGSPGKPTDNTFIESFNRRPKQKGLSVNEFLRLANCG